MTSILNSPCDESVIRTASRAQPCQRDVRPWVLAATILGSSMAMIDGSVVNVALPVMQARLNATATQVQWVVESYALFLAALILVGGSLGDRYGRRRIFAVGVAVFAVASVGCGLALDVNQLILARSLQGIGGALLVPGSLAIISAAFDAERRGRAIGTWSGFTAITSALGPVLGGWLVEQVSWRAIFFLNVPLAIVVLAIAFWRVPESRDEDSRSLDWQGAVFATIGLGSLVYGLLESSHLGIAHPVVLVTIGGGIAALIGFIRTEATVRFPLMPLQLFRSSTFSGANLLTLLLYSALGGVLFFFPFNLIQVQGYSATAAGAAFLPLILSMFVLSRWSGGLVSRYGAKQPLIIGPTIAAIGFALFAVPGIGGSYWTTFFPAVLVLGFGMAISVAPLTTTIMSAVKTQQAGVASGINNAVARTAGLLAIALLSPIVALVFNSALDARLTRLQVSPAVRQLLAPERIKLAGAQIPRGLGEGVSAALKSAIAESFISSFRAVMIIAAGLAIASAFAAAFMIQPQQSERSRVQDTTFSKRNR
jgi:EmrB/QacA subfamily drug resistance transporter